MYFSALLNALNRPAILWSMRGEVLAVNPLLKTVCEVAEPPLGTVWPVIPGRAKLFKAVAASPDASLVTQFDIIAESGQDIGVQCQLRPIIEDGKCVAVLGMCETNSSHLHGNALGQEMSRNFIAATEIAHIIAFTMDPETGEMSLSQSFATLVGMIREGPPDRLQSLADWAHPEDYARAKPWLDALVRGEIRRFNGDMRLHCDDVGWVWSNIKAQMRDRSALGLPPIICGCAVDVSDYKRNATRLEEAYKAAEIARRSEAAMRKEAKETEKMFRLAVTNGEIGPFSFCVETGKGWMMAETARMLGYEPGAEDAALTGRIERLHPDDVEIAKNGIRDLVAGRTDVYAADTRQRHADGSYHWYRTKCRLVDRSDQNLPPLVAGVSTNIDQIKESEDKLAEALEEAKAARARLNRLTDNAPTALYELLLSNDGSVSMPYFSAKLGDLFGVPDEELRANPTLPQAMIAPEDRAFFLEHVVAANKTLIPFSVEVRVNHPRDGLKWLQIASNPNRLPTGETLSYASVTDVTERKNAEERASLAAARAERTLRRLNRLADNAPAALFEIRQDKTGHRHLSFFSAKLPQMLGVPADDLASDIQTFFRHIPDKDRITFQNLIDDRQTQDNFFVTDLRVQHPMQGTRWLQLAAMPQTTEKGERLHYASLSDITAIREAEQRAKDALGASELAHERLNLLTQNTPIGLYEVHGTDEGELHVAYANPKQIALRGVTAEQLFSDVNTASQLVHPEDRDRVMQAKKRSARLLEPYDVQYRVLHPERGEISLLSRSVPHRNENGGVTWYGSTVDLTDRLEMEQKVAAAAKDAEDSHARLASLADAAPVGLYESSPLDSEDVRYVYTSARFDEMLGLQNVPEDEKFVAAIDRIHPDDRDEVLAKATASLQSGDNVAMRMRVRHPSKGLRWMSVSAVVKLTETGSPAHVGAIIDITKDVEAEAKLRLAHELADKMRMENEIRALHDPLTGLPNRRSFDQQLADCFAAATKDETRHSIGLIRIDGDRFKYINDTFGHEAGDAVLVRIAEVMRRESGQDDFPARVGGDEFSILLPAYADEAHATALVERIQAGLADPLYFKGRRCMIQASFGVAFVDATHETGTDLLAFADAALYRAKEKGRNRMEVFTETLRAEISGTRRLASELQDALVSESFEPFFQPQVDIETGRLFGAEVLMRWRHPERGILAPDEFLGVADQLRMVPDLDRLMMMKTHTILQDLRGRGLHVPKVSFNISSGRMLDEDLISSAKALLDDGVQLTVELLESTLVEEEGEVFNFHLDLLRDMGIEIEIDDFGSGHASIIALMAVAPNALKIDRRLIAPVAEDMRARKLVRAIVEIAETLNINTIAEGVEEDAQVDVLRDLGCNVVQGYLFARPLDAAAFEDWLRNDTWLNRLSGYSVAP